jgi:hypothetical protein
MTSSHYSPLYLPRVLDFLRLTKAQRSSVKTMQLYRDGVSSRVGRTGRLLRACVFAAGRRCVGAGAKLNKEAQDKAAANGIRNLTIEPLCDREGVPDVGRGNRTIGDTRLVPTRENRVLCGYGWAGVDRVVLLLP